MVRIGENSYYTQTQVCTADLIVYDPTSWTQGAGIITSGGLRVFSFRSRYESETSTAPEGSLNFMDLSSPRRPKTISATAFTSMAIPENTNIATIEGFCSLNGVSGYTFTLIVEDNDTRLVNSTDRIHLTVYDSTGAVVYDINEKVFAGMVRINRL